MSKLAEGEKALFAELRRQQIAQMVQQSGKVTVENLSSHFQVSPPTIRNDLTELERLGLLQRTHGGAISRNFSGYELTSQQKSAKNVVQKQAIAQAALNYIHPGDVIALDTGTTTLELAKLLGNIRDLTVITYDITIASTLEAYDNITVILLGGTLRHHFHCTTGNAVLEALNSLYIDTAFLATNGMSLQRGFSAHKTEIADIKQKMIASSGKIVLLADSTKIGTEAFVSFAPLSESNVIITDHQADPSFVKDAASLGIEVIQAGPKNL